MLPATANGRLDRTSSVCGHPRIERYRSATTSTSVSGDDVAEPRFHLREELVLPGPLQSVARGQLQLRSDERFRIVNPSAEVALCRIDVCEHVTHQNTVLVFDHGWAGDDADLRQLAERHGRTGLAVLLE